VSECVSGWQREGILSQCQVEQCATSTEGNRAGVEWRTASLIKRECISAQLSSLQTRVSSLLSGYSSVPYPREERVVDPFEVAGAGPRLKLLRDTQQFRLFLYYSIKNTYLFLNLSCGVLF